ncbi:MAG: DUF4294 domain-containing protein [Chitinophagaceae bacterium]
MKIQYLPIYLFISFILFSNTLVAQQSFPLVNNEDSPSYHVRLNEAVIVDKRIFENDTMRYNYNQMKYYIKTVMPYVNVATIMFKDIQDKTSSMNRRDRKAYIKSKEGEIKVNFEDQLKKLNITQGKYLIKLINRQTKINCYQIVRELKNPISAAYYQSWAKLNGINLNEAYDPEKEHEMERIMRSLGY